MSCFRKSWPLLRYSDEFHGRVTEIVDMPSRTVDTLLGFLRQNGSRVGRRARDRELKALTEDEVAIVEAIVADLSA